MNARRAVEDEIGRASQLSSWGTSGATTEAVGISDDAYHWLAVTGGLAASVLVAAGIVVLAYRRLTVDRVAATTLRSDRVLYPLLVLTIAAGIAATILTAVDRYGYRETVSPWFRGIFTLRPDGAPMVGAPFVFQLHAVTAWLLFAIWPFTRLVHVWSVPVTYLGRAPILLQAPSRTPVTEASRLTETQVVFLTGLVNIGQDWGGGAERPSAGWIAMRSLGEISCSPPRLSRCRSAPGG